ncbi:MAG: hypothetical protein BWK80_59345 [Desulfobacteraceae bacterium IS3]|nr:MAG: hypothetical protein BWK80_59345 [Desulfobacteraceae bacterium IS3]HAO23204.1 hypothetical protein [Desulfobacteraceae bacterium]
MHIISDESNPPWKIWEEYERITIGSREYAKVGKRLYTRHTVERTYPAIMGGRSIAPGFIEDAIRTGTTRKVTVNGVERTIHTSGTVQVITEQDGNIVVTVNPFSGGQLK